MIFTVVLHSIPVNCEAAYYCCLVVINLNVRTVRQIVCYLIVKFIHTYNQAYIGISEPSRYEDIQESIELIVNQFDLH